MDLDQMKIWLRVDGSDDDLIIESLMGAAKQYITNATGFVFDSLADSNDLATLAVRILVTHWYEKREPTGQAGLLEFSLRSILGQLQYCGGEASTS